MRIEDGRTLASSIPQSPLFFSNLISSLWLLKRRCLNNIRSFRLTKQTMVTATDLLQAKVRRTKAEGIKTHLVFWACILSWPMRLPLGVCGFIYYSLQSKADASVFSGSAPFSSSCFPSKRSSVKGNISSVCPSIWQGGTASDSGRLGYEAINRHADTATARKTTRSVWLCPRVSFMEGNTEEILIGIWFYKASSRPSASSILLRAAYTSLRSSITTSYSSC